MYIFSSPFIKIIKLQVAKISTSIKLKLYTKKNIETATVLELNANHVLI